MITGWRDTQTAKGSRKTVGSYSLVNWHKVLTSAYKPSDTVNTTDLVENTARTWDNVPVFMLSVNNMNIIKQDDRVCSYFMDFRNATDVLAEFHLHGFLNSKIFNIQTISLKEWFQLVDPKLNRIKGFSSPLLKPSPHQNRKISYKLKKKGNQEPIPLYFCDYTPPSSHFNTDVNKKSTNKVKGPGTDTNNSNKCENGLTRVYFFNYKDLIREIGKIQGKLEREKALNSVKIVSLMDLLMTHENDRGKLLFVPSSHNISYINKMSKHTTPWITL
nr:hypothetical protein MACL_00002706 [Theileria orientalis]